MADRNRYLLTYDIRHPRRRRVHRVAKDHGDALQYSVFVCDLTKVELITMRSLLLEEINQQEDSIGIFDLGPPTGRGLACVEFIGVRLPLPGGDAAIW